MIFNKFISGFTKKDPVAVFILTSMAKMATNMAATNKRRNLDCERQFASCKESTQVYIDGIIDILHDDS